MTITKILKQICILFLVIIILSTTFVSAIRVDPDCPTDFEVIESVAATLTENGHTTYRCRLCGTTYTEILRATGYAWGEWYVYYEPTCVKAGTKRRSRILGEPRMQNQPIPALEHEWSETTDESACGEYGRIFKTCQTCGEVETIKELDQLECRWGEWNTYVEPQEGVEGLQYRECGICDERQYQSIVALPIAPQLPPEEEAPHWFGADEAIVTGANIILWIVAAILLASEFGLLLWERRRKKEILRRKQIGENGENGYELI